jgi:hypothetical protein
MRGYDVEGILEQGLLLMDTINVQNYDDNVYANEFLTFVCNLCSSKDDALNNQAYVKQVVDLVYSMYVKDAFVFTMALTTLYTFVMYGILRDDETVFEMVYTSNSYCIDTEYCKKYLKLIEMWLTRSLQNKWNLHVIAANHVSCLDSLSDLGFSETVRRIKQNLIYTSLYEKCRFFIDCHKEHYSLKALSDTTYSDQIVSR